MTRSLSPSPISSLDITLPRPPAIQFFVLTKWNFGSSLSTTLSYAHQCPGDLPILWNLTQHLLLVPAHLLLQWPTSSRCHRLDNPLSPCTSPTVWIDLLMCLDSQVGGDCQGRDHHVLFIPVEHTVVRWIDGWRERSSRISSGGWQYGCGAQQRDEGQRYTSKSYKWIIVSPVRMKVITREKEGRLKRKADQRQSLELLQLRVDGRRGASKEGWEEVSSGGRGAKRAELKKQGKARLSIGNFKWAWGHSVEQNHWLNKTSIMRTGQQARHAREKLLKSGH